MRRTAPAGPRARGGFTLIEMLIGMAVFSMVLAAVGATVLSSTGAFEQGATAAELELRARRMVDRIASDLTGALLVSLTPTPAGFGSATMDFRTSAGFAAGAVVPGPLRTYRLQMAPGELDDGIDNDGDGLVDERQVVLVEDPGGPDERTIGLCSPVRELLEGELPDVADNNGNGLVDEAGLSFWLDPATSTLTIRLTLERFDGAGALVTRTVETAVRIRN